MERKMQGWPTDLSTFNPPCLHGNGMISEIAKFFNRNSGYARLDILHVPLSAFGGLLILLVTLSCLACASYVGSGETANKMNPKIFLDINSNGKKIEVKVGGEIEIGLKAIGGAGYAWYFDKLDRDFFDLTGEEPTVAAPERADVVGTPVVTIWKLKARKPGTSLIRMLYYRQWEGKEKAANQFEVVVNITP